MEHCQAKHALGLDPGVGTGSPSDNATNLMSVDNLAGRGVNGLADHSATAPEQSQHVDKPIAVTAKPGPHQIGELAALAPESDHPSERDGFLVGNRRALFGLVQAAIVRRIGGQSRRGHKAEHEDGGEQSGDRHGRDFERAPVNAG
jgi:hypothetical protein